MKRLIAVLIVLTLGFSALSYAADKNSSSSSKPAATQPARFEIDINRANADELMTLKGSRHKANAFRD